MRKEISKTYIKKVCIFILGNAVLTLLLSPLVIFYGPFPSLKAFAVASILTSRHPQVAEFFLPLKEVEKLLTEYRRNVVTVEPVVVGKERAYWDQENKILLESVEGKYFRGYVMQIGDPKDVRVAVTKELEKAGQLLTVMVQENGAVAGMNGGGFYDPNSRGNGAYPDGITITDGVVVHNNLGDEKGSLIALDGEGRLILEEMTAKEAISKGIRDAVTFEPYLIRDGQPLIEGDGGWGLAPRAGIGQKADGTLVFVVIDGRQPGWSMGATLRDLMNIFVEYGAAWAANLDGGSSAELVYKGQIINQLWNIHGERYMPTAFIVVPSGKGSGL